MHKRKVFDYGEREAIADLALNFTRNYAVNFKVMNEIMLKYPDFSPTTMLDYGSGTSPAFWAAYDTWKIESYHGVDISDEMNSLSQSIFDTLKMKAKFSNVLDRDIDYDLVVASNIISDLNNDEDRVEVIDSLWKHTKDTLVIIERGTPVQAGETAGTPG